jgi:hypothetical protein
MSTVVVEIVVLSSSSVVAPAPPYASVNCARVHNKKVGQHWYTLRRRGYGCLECFWIFVKCQSYLGTSSTPRHASGSVLYHEPSNKYEG